MNFVLPDIHPLLQPDESGICGQTCVAMAAGVSIHEAVAACGATTMRGAGTDVHQVARGLRKLGLRVGSSSEHTSHGRKMLSNLPKRAIMSIFFRHRPGAGHWVLLWDGYVYDPGMGWPMPLYAYESYIIERAYSRRFKRPKSRSLYAYWDIVIPILERKK